MTNLNRDLFIDIDKYLCKIIILTNMNKNAIVSHLQHQPLQIKTKNQRQFILQTFYVGNFCELPLYIHSNPTLNNTHVRPQKL